MPSCGTEPWLRDLHWPVVGQRCDMSHFLLKALGVSVCLTAASYTSLQGGQQSSRESPPVKLSPQSGEA